MNLLFDQNISHRLISQIKDIFPLAKQVRELGLENQSDIKIWGFSKKHNYTIVTFDGDFYDLSIVRGHPPKIILIKTYNQTTVNIERILRINLTAISGFIKKDSLACLEILSFE
jgi:predicted nuclease of predicted toxin-antitoxin system